MKSDNKDIYNVTEIEFYSKKNLLFIKESHQINPTKNSTKIVISTTVFYINNNKKCFLSSKSAYQNDFWRIMWHRRQE